MSFSQTVLDKKFSVSISVICASENQCFKLLVRSLKLVSTFFFIFLFVGWFVVFFFSFKLQLFLVFFNPSFRGLNCPNVCEYNTLQQLPVTLIGLLSSSSRTSCFIFLIHIYKCGPDGRVLVVVGVCLQSPEDKFCRKTTKTSKLSDKYLY